MSNPTDRILSGEVFDSQGTYAIGTKANGDLANVTRAPGCSDEDYQRILNIVHAAVEGIALDSIPTKPTPNAVAPDEDGPAVFVEDLDDDFQRDTDPSLKGWRGVCDESQGGYVAFTRDEADAIAVRQARRLRSGTY